MCSAIYSKTKCTSKKPNTINNFILWLVCCCISLIIILDWLSCNETYWFSSGCDSRFNALLEDGALD